LRTTFVRVGNEEYARANGSYGRTTLRDRHAHLEGSKLRLRFKAKSAKTHDVVVEDRRLARLVRRCQELPGQILFQYVDADGHYVDADGHRHPIRSNDVNDYVRAVTGLPSTAKTFRTWGGTLLAAVALASVAPPTSPREGKRVVTSMLTVVSRELNNTPAVCRRSYVHPAVVDSYLRGQWPDQWHEASARGSHLLSADERRLVPFLDRVPAICAAA
jgi:DNA topoisomerase-1